MANVVITQGEKHKPLTEKSIWVLFPTVQEAKALPGKARRIAAGVVAKEICNFPGKVYSFVIGVGKQCSYTLNLLIQSDLHKIIPFPDWIILSGYSGSCRPEITMGQIIVGNKITYQNVDYSFFSNLTMLEDKALVGPVMSVEEISDVEGKKRLGDRGFIAVEMEAGLLAKEIYPGFANRIILLKGVFDTVDFEIPQGLQISPENAGKISWFQFFWWVFHPINWFHLFTLWKMSRKVNEELRKVLKLVIFGLFRP